MSNFEELFDSLISEGEDSEPSQNKEAPIDRLRVDGSTLCTLKNSASSSTLNKITETAMNHSSNNPPSLTIETQIQLEKQPSLLRRHDFIRRSMVSSREQKASSPTFLIEGKRVADKERDSPKPENNPPPNSGKASYTDMNLEGLVINSTTNLPDPSKLNLPVKQKSDQQPSVSKSTAVALPILHIDGPGFLHNAKGGNSAQSKTFSLPDGAYDLQQQLINGEVMEGLGDTEMNSVFLANQPGQPPESVWSEVNEQDFRQRRVKRNNFFQAVGTRLPETDYTELCVETSRQPPPTSGELSPNQKPSTSRTINLHLNCQRQQKLNISRNKPPRQSPKEKPASFKRPQFQSVNSYLNFNKSGRSSMYKSEPAGLFDKMDENILQPIDLHNRQYLSRHLIARSSDLAIHSTLNEYFRIKAVKVNL